MQRRQLGVCQHHHHSIASDQLRRRPAASGPSRARSRSTSSRLPHACHSKHLPIGMQLQSKKTPAPSGKALRYRAGPPAKRSGATVRGVWSAAPQAYKAPEAASPCGIAVPQGEGMRWTSLAILGALAVAGCTTTRRIPLGDLTLIANRNVPAELMEIMEAGVGEQVCEEIGPTNFSSPTLSQVISEAQRKVPGFGCARERRDHPDPGDRRERHPLVHSRAGRRGAIPHEVGGRSRLPHQPS